MISRQTTSKSILDFIIGAMIGVLFLSIYFSQIMKLLTSDKPSEFTNETIRSKNYNEITDYPMLITILQKFKDEVGFLSR
jgi:hypothetical protein